MSSNLQTIAIAGAFVWLFILTFFYLKVFSRYTMVTKGGKHKNIATVLEELVKTSQILLKDVDYLKDRCDKIEEDGKFHIQKIGILRFNPFKDTGGDQSFIVALVDGHDTGIVISGLYSRSGTRWYAKRVVEGKPIDHQFSEEEKKALAQAKDLTLQAKKESKKV
jgi:hypothetical protein